MKETERIKFTIVGIEKEIRTVKETPELVYKFTVNETNSILFFKTKIAYESEYDILLNKTNCISAVVEYINEKRKNIVITGIRYLKPTSEDKKNIG